MYGMRYLRVFDYVSVSECATGPARESEIDHRFPLSEGCFKLTEFCSMFQLFYFGRISLLGIKFVIFPANTVICCDCIFIA